MDNIRSVLERYLPPGTAELFTDWVYEYRIHLHITRDRRSKCGDYRAPTHDDPRHRISINHNLNPYAFLLTLAHEIAHLAVREKYSPRVKPHGEEWKKEFRRFMYPFLAGNTFPPELRIVVIRHMEKAWASSGTDLSLSRALRKYDREEEKNIVFVEDLEPGTLFRIGDTRVFRKGELLRKRYRCECITNRKIYLVNGNAQVFTIN
jgi:SprT protein